MVMDELDIKKAWFALMQRRACEEHLQVFFDWLLVPNEHALDMAEKAFGWNFARSVYLAANDVAATDLPLFYTQIAVEAVLFRDELTHGEVES